MDSEIKKKKIVSLLDTIIQLNDVYIQKLNDEEEAYTKELEENNDKGYVDIEAERAYIYFNDIIFNKERYVEDLKRKMLISKNDKEIDITSKEISILNENIAYTKDRLKELEEPIAKRNEYIKTMEWTVESLKEKIELLKKEYDIGLKKILGQTTLEQFNKMTKDALENSRLIQIKNPIEIRESWLISWATARLSALEKYQNAKMYADWEQIIEKTSKNYITRNDYEHHTDGYIKGYVSRYEEMLKKIDKLKDKEEKLKYIEKTLPKIDKQYLDLSGAILREKDNYLEMYLKILPYTEARRGYFEEIRRGMITAKDVRETIVSLGKSLGAGIETKDNKFLEDYKYRYNQEIDTLKKEEIKLSKQVIKLQKILEQKIKNAFEKADKDLAIKQAKNANERDNIKKAIESSKDWLKKIESSTIVDNKKMETKFTENKIKELEVKLNDAIIAKLHNIKDRFKQIQADIKELKNAKITKLIEEKIKRINQIRRKLGIADVVTESKIEKAEQRLKEEKEKAKEKMHRLNKYNKDFEKMPKSVNSYKVG